jgi:transcriptional regulator with XRE-family HTH domain
MPKPVNYRTVIADLNKRIAKGTLELQKLRRFKQTCQAMLAREARRDEPAPLPRRRRRRPGPRPGTPTGDANVRAVLKKRPWFSHLLRSWRQANSLTQESACRMLQVNSIRMSLYETGREIPKPDVLMRMAVALELPESFLLSLVADRHHYYTEPQWIREFKGWAHQKQEAERRGLQLPHFTDEDRTYGAAMAKAAAKQEGRPEPLDIVEDRSPEQQAEDGDSEPSRDTTSDAAMRAMTEGNFK